MRTIKLILAYDGTGYCGWQRQRNGLSIQQEVERAATIICNEPITVHGAGRTDAGVHALGMTAHFATASSVAAPALHKGLNALLPAAIRVVSLADVPASFHARFSAIAKTYRYTVYTGPVLCPLQRLSTAHFPYALDPVSMTEALQQLVGTHDFGGFETSGSRDKTRIDGRGAVRTIVSATLEETTPGWYRITLTGDGFLRQMVRNIVGTLLEVGRGKRSVASFAAVLDHRDRNLAGPTAPAHGLTLMTVHYRSESTKSGHG